MQQAQQRVQLQGRAGIRIKHSADGTPRGRYPKTATGRFGNPRRPTGDKTLPQVGNIRVNSTLNELRAAFSGHLTE